MTVDANTTHDGDATTVGKCLISRRQFLLTSGLTVATVMVVVNSVTPCAYEVRAFVSTYPSKFVVKL